MEVEVISTDTIKPSSPTPPHLKIFKISLMDRMFQNAYIPFVTFYAAIKDTPPPTLSVKESPAEQQLKLSLAETLTRFYPFAGRANNRDYTIDCNDKGVLFSTARVKCHLRDVLKEPKIEEFHKFLVPYPPMCPEYSLPEDGPTLIGVQLNVFDCGGLALSVFISHLICDVVTLTSFMKCWSEIARKSANQVVYPIFPAAAELFLQGEEELLPADDTSYVIERSLLRSEGYAVIRRFVFDGRAIKSLRDKARSEHVPNPSRVEAVSMFMWKHCMAASVVAWGTHQPSVLSFLVDVRRRMVPPLSEYSVGNIVWKVMTRIQTQDEIDVDGLVTLFRAAMEENRDVTVPKIQNNGGQVAVLNYFEELKEICRDTNLILYNISSWCRIGLNEVDFGWGKPVWVSQVGAKYLSLPCANSAMLLDGDAAGDNIELWLILDHREMAVLETDSEFLAFASPNPPILI